MKKLLRSRGYLPLSSLLLLLALVCAMPASGQTLDSRSFDTEVRPQSSSRGASPPAQSGGWLTVAPVGEEFTVLMPYRPRLRTENDTVSFEQSVHFYGSSNESNMYMITSSSRAKMSGASVEAMLNPLAGESAHPLFKDVRQRGGRIDVIEKRDLSLSGYRGREYRLSFSNETPCVARVYVTNRRVYTLIWLYNYVPGSPGHIDQDSFLSSFSLGPINRDAAASNVQVGDERTDELRAGVGPGCGGAGCAGTGQGGYTGSDTGGGGSGGPSNNDPDRGFSVREVTQKARIISKPEPAYTTEARQNNVSGTVVLKVVFGADGVVRNIRAVSGLPFGLTERAIAAARQLRFSPAMKDGRPVSQSVVIEYNFNPY
jgi:TonB family protein